MSTSEIAARMSEVGDAATKLRSFLEPRWEEYKIESGRPIGFMEAISASMCGFSSAFAAIVLGTQDGATWRVAGGTPENGGGVLGADSRLKGHFWTVSDDGIVVDLTADQFGLPAVVVTSQRDSRFRESFSPHEIELHMPRVLPVAHDWIEHAMEYGIVPSSMRLAA